MGVVYLLVLPMGTEQTDLEKVPVTARVPEVMRSWTEARVVRVSRVVVVAGEERAGGFGMMVAKCCLKSVL